MIKLILHKIILAEKTARANIGIVLSISNKLRDIGRPVAANLLIGKIINSLPESYARVRSVWEATPVAERTMEILQSRLIAEEKVIACYKTSHSNTTAFQASGKST